jgi:hypothetical protein
MAPKPASASLARPPEAKDRRAQRRRAELDFQRRAFWTRVRRVTTLLLERYGLKLTISLRLSVLSGSWLH